MESTFEDQATIIKKRFAEKGYPKHLVTEAYNKTKTASQKEYLGLEGNDSQIIAIDTTKRRKDDTHNTGVFDWSHLEIQRILAKNWFILKSDPILKDIIPERPTITFRRAPTIKNIVAPSRLKQHSKKGTSSIRMYLWSPICGENYPETAPENQ